jgi:hypothetical protein
VTSGTWFGARDCRRESPAPRSRTAPGSRRLGSGLVLTAFLGVATVGCAKTGSVTSEGVAGASGTGAGSGGRVGSGGAGPRSSGAGGASDNGTSATGGIGGQGGLTASGGTTGGSGGSGGSGGGGGSVATGGGGAGADGTTGTGAAAAAGGMTGGAAGTPTGGVGGSGATMALLGPCDLFAAGNTPCVAAHSTVRALSGSYSGSLYQVRRASDKTTMDIGVMAPGGFSNSAAQDAFCAGTTCTISVIYDQSMKGNHLTSAPAGGAKNTPDKEASATALELTVGGHRVYAVYIDTGMGYRIDKTSGLATGDQPEAEYMVTSGTHYNGGCCFDYGNAETDDHDDGSGTMEAVYFGSCTSWGKGGGSGPWVMADLENGLFAGQSFAANGNDTPLALDYVTAMVKGKPGQFALKGASGQTGALKTMYDGARPTSPGYSPMKKQGAIILGIGGDNSNSAVGSFFEGCITSGYPSDATDDAVQANIVAAGYGR